MSFYIPTTYDTSVNLQSTLASATSATDLAGTITGSHHPISCTGPLYLEEDNTIRCEHSESPADNPRNQAILDASIALLIIELAYKKL